MAFRCTLDCIVPSFSMWKILIILSSDYDSNCVSFQVSYITNPQRFTYS